MQQHPQLGRSAPAEATTVFRVALGQRAADLDRTDPDQVVRNPWVPWSSGAVGVLAVLFIGLFLAFGPGPFFPSLAAPSCPFPSRPSPPDPDRGVQPPPPEMPPSPLATPSRSSSTSPGGFRVAGTAMLPGCRPAQGEEESYREQAFTHDESGREWSTTIDPADVGNGFLYKVTAGDAVTPEYRVRSRPFRASFGSRPSTSTDPTRGWPIRSVWPRLEGLRGTKVTLTVRANRTLESGRLRSGGRGRAGVTGMISGRVVNGKPGSPTPSNSPSRSSNPASTDFGSAPPRAKIMPRAATRTSWSTTMSRPWCRSSSRMET